MARMLTKQKMGIVLLQEQGADQRSELLRRTDTRQDNPKSCIQNIKYTLLYFQNSTRHSLRLDHAVEELYNKETTKTERSTKVEQSSF